VAKIFGSALLQPARSVCVSSERFFIHFNADGNYTVVKCCIGPDINRKPFCRATLCVSAVFAVAGSVRLSVTFVSCTQTAEDIVKFLSRPRSSIILVFVPQRRYPIPRGTPSAGRKYNGWKISDLRLKSPFILETVQDRPILL